MSKELTPLENFEYFIRCFAIDTNEELDTIKKLYAGTIKVITSALKRLDYIDENKIYCISENYLQDIKKIKALEIIKEKQVNVAALLELDSLQQYNDYCDMVGGCKKLIQEEYESIKEALKDE